jgi:hypothetical protein
MIPTPKLLSLSAACLLALTGCQINKPNLTSDLRIEPGQEFQYGGGMNGSYKIKATNKSAVPIRIIALDPGSQPGRRTEIIQIKSGETATHQFSNGQIAVLANTSKTEQARADVFIWGSTNVEMKYEPTK